MKLKLYHRDKTLGDAWSVFFDDIDRIDIINGNICDTDCDAIVSPANSFGFMDGGLDWQLSEKFGWDLQERVQRIIKERAINELLVGEALIVSTSSKKIPWVICAPTMRVPMHIKTSINAYLAMKAILTTVLRHREKPEMNSVAIPGLGTGVGALAHESCAVQMYTAYKEIILGEFEFPKDFGAAQKAQLKLNDKGMIYD